MNQISANSKLQTLSPVPGRSASRPQLPADRFESSSTASGPNWGLIGLGALGLLASGVGVVQAQVQTQPPLVVAHRGETDHAKENSMEAFRQALAEGAGAVELDIHLTADGDLAVNHDDTLDRTYGVPGVVREMTSDQLRAAGVPMLSDVLELPDCKFIIEIKHPKGGRHQGIEQILIDQLQKSDAEDRAVVISFDETSLKTLHSLDPELTTGYLYSGKDLDPKQTREELGVTYLGPHFSAVNEEYVEKAHEAGMKVNPWTVNEEKDLQHMLDLGVDAITTDNAGDLSMLISPRA
jgi:glycerophosphoryl diester phosphodiesterase